MVSSKGPIAGELQSQALLRSILKLQVSQRTSFILQNFTFKNATDKDFTQCYNKRVLKQMLLSNLAVSVATIFEEFFNDYNTVLRSSPLLSLTFKAGL